MAPTDADVATTQLSTMHASAAILSVLSIFSSHHREFFVRCIELDLPASPSVTHTPTSLPGVRESAGEAQDLGHGASSLEAGANVVAPIVWT